MELASVPPKAARAELVEADTMSKAFANLASVPIHFDFLDRGIVVQRSATAARIDDGMDAELSMARSRAAHVERLFHFVLVFLARLESR